MGWGTFWSFCAIPFSADWAAAGALCRARMPARIGWNETRSPYGDEDSRKAEEGLSEDRQRQGECAAAADQAIGRTERGRRRRPTAEGRGGEQGLGIHQGQQPADPREPPRDPGRRQAPQGVRQGQGDHVRDEQAPRPAPKVRQRSTLTTAIARSERCYLTPTEDVSDRR